MPFLYTLCRLHLCFVDVVSFHCVSLISALHIFNNFHISEVNLSVKYDNVFLHFGKCSPLIYVKKICLSYLSSWVIQATRAFYAILFSNWGHNWIVSFADLSLRFYGRTLRLPTDGLSPGMIWKRSCINVYILQFINIRC